MPQAWHPTFPASATPVPSPSPTSPPPELVTPGFLGFFIIVVLVVAVFLLVWDMNRRVRRARYREQISAELDAEQAQTDDPESPEASDPTEPGDQEPPDGR